MLLAEIAPESLKFLRVYKVFYMMICGAATHCFSIGFSMFPTVTFSRREVVILLMVFVYILRPFRGNDSRMTHFLQILQGNFSNFLRSHKTLFPPWPFPVLDGCVSALRNSEIPNAFRYIMNEFMPKTPQKL